MTADVSILKLMTGSRKCPEVEIQPELKAIYSYACIFNREEM
jgi:hypothetical protein